MNEELKPEEGIAEKAINKARAEFTKEELATLFEICQKISIDGAHAKMLGIIIDKIQMQIIDRR